MASEESQPLDGPTLLRYVNEVANELPDDDEHRRLVVVGGALLAWSELRDATRDIDCAEPLDQPLRSAFQRTSEAVDAFHRAYPHEEPDLHLPAWIAEIVGD